MSSKLDDNRWLIRGLTAARDEVARWLEWKKQAMRVLPDPKPAAEPSATRGSASGSTPTSE